MKLADAGRAALSRIMSALPSGTPAFVYKHLLILPPLRALTNRLLLMMIPASITIPEAVVFLNPDDPVISGALALAVYEPFETEVFRTLLAPGMTVLDIGANIGYYALIAAAHVGTNGRVLAFEPEPISYSLLEKNVSQNAFAQVRTYAIALADHEGTMELNVSRTNKGNHSLVNTSEHSREFTETVSVPVRTLDALLSEAGIPSVDVIKMDVEGAEPLALAGMSRTIAAHADLVLFLEFYPTMLRRVGADPAAFLDGLAKDGFTLYEMREEERTILPLPALPEFVARFSKTDYTNLLCIKGDRKPPSVS